MSRMSSIALAATVATTAAARVDDKAAVRNAEAIPESRYVMVKDGQLKLAGKRVRYWAVIGSFPNVPKFGKSESAKRRAEKIDQAYRDVDLFVQRFQDLGFNMNRIWHAFDAKSNHYTKGDGSRADVVDRFIHRMSQKGFKFWCAGMNRVGGVQSSDVDIIDDPKTRKAWMAGIDEWNARKKDVRRARNSKMVSLSGANMARIWDPRLEALGIQRMHAVATHINQHSGLRWCDDPAFAVWELSNEEWWMSKMVGGNWQKLPDFFKKQLIDKWHVFLKKKYNDRNGIIKAWHGLLPGESLSKGTVLLAPLRKETKPVALNDASRHVQFEGVKQAYGREDFCAQRGRDVIAFFLELQIAHKQREAAAVKSWGRSTKLCPLVWDTGIGYEIQSQFLHQQADAVAHDAYIKGVSPHKSHHRYPWYSGLEEPPRICHDVPWLEHNRVEGKPYFCYETQIMQPAKYRAEYPMRFAALASIQDWDVACWHYWGSVSDIGTNPKPFAKAMDVTVGSHPQGYHFTYDEVQAASMKLASMIWRHIHLKPAPKPTKFIYGRNSLLDPVSMDYGRSYGPNGLNMLPTTYQYGVRIEIDPTREDDEVVGPVVHWNHDASPSPVAPTQQIAFNWHDGNLIFDAPGAACFTGFLAKYRKADVRFNNGVVISDVAIQNDPGIAFPVTDDEKYVTIAIAADSKLPLARAKRITMCAVSTSFNTDFRLAGYGRAKKTNKGKTPVLYARVGCTIAAPALDGMRYVFRDWHMKSIGKGVVRNGRLKIPANKPVFVVELSR